MDLITMIFWTALSIALGYPVNGQEAIRGLPCIQRLHQLYCRNQGSQYPEDRIEMFIDLNKALTRRMFGEYQPPGELFEEVPAFPNIQQFETIDFPEYLRPAGWRRAGSAFEQVPAPPADRRQTRRPPRLRPRARARANANASARASTTRAGATKRAMTKVRPTRVATRPPAKRLVTQTPVRPPFVNNVFLNQGAELLAAASQPAAHAGRRYPRRQAPANQRFGPRVKRSSNDTMASPPLRRRRRRQSVPPPPKIDKGSKHLVDSCESKIEIITPYWAANSAGEIRAIVNTKHFPQAIHQEICKGTTTSHCSGSCVCEQKYTYHRLLAYDPENDCKGIFIDWFLFPSCCACRCPP